MTTRNKLTPRTALTTKELCALPRDNADSRDFWIMVGTKHVTITAQRVGHKHTAMVTMPKAQFNRFVDWYNTGTLRRVPARAKRVPEKSKRRAAAPGEPQQ